MELPDIQRHDCKFSLIANNRSAKVESTILGSYNPDEGEYREPKRRSAVNFVDLGGWPSSRIVRVSRASGGKDRHSKVLTSKGLRDRRVRLSVNTAIQFYDLQDRLGYDQPSKAVEWLLKAADSSIQELPPISSLFPGTPKRLTDETGSCNGGSNGNQLGLLETDVNGGRYLNPNYNQRREMPKSGACSSPSGSSEGSGLSLSRSKSRIEARNRANERTAVKKGEKENEFSPIYQSTSFTELLSVGLSNLTNYDHNSTAISTTGSSSNSNHAANELHFIQKSPKQWSSAPMDYLPYGILGPPAAGRSSTSSYLFSLAGGQHLPYVPDQLVSVVNAAAVENNDRNDNHQNDSNEYNLNFTMSSCPNSSGLSGFNRGTLQSNSISPSLVPHIQRFPHIDGPPSSFFIGNTVPVGSHYQFLPGFDSGLQLYRGNDLASNAGRQSDQKETENN